MSQGSSFWRSAPLCEQQSLHVGGVPENAGPLHRFGPCRPRRRLSCDLERCQDERNWLLQVAEDHEPEAVKRLTAQQLGFLDALAAKLATIPWDVSSVETFDYGKALALQEAFHQVRVGEGIPLRAALTAVFDSFLDSPFSIQVGLFLMRLDRSFALERLRRVSGARRLVA